MKIENYISQLLYRYQCVTVPGFGAFLTENQSAELNTTTQSFFAPKKMISFNAFLKNNDGLLANHVAVSEKISYDVAVAGIENEVAQWKNNLHIFGTIVIKNIGEIVLNSEQNLLFIPFNQPNYLTTSFGLSSFVSPAIKREAYINVVEVFEEKAPVVFIPQKNEELLEKSPFGFMKYAAIFVLGAGLLAGGGYLGNLQYQKNIDEQTLAVQTKVQQKVQQKIQEATFYIQNPLPSVTLNVGNNSKLPYHVVAGAFRLESNADKIYDELIKIGYKARKLSKNKNGLYPVLYGSFSRYADAEVATQKIKKEHNPEAWLLIQEL